MKTRQKPSDCPCGSGRPLAQCCEPLMHSRIPAQSAEQLMRSRYTAYCLRHEDWLRASWHPSTRPAPGTSLADPAIKWLGLQIHDHQPGLHESHVCFTATCKISGRLQRMNENSRFVLENGLWLYVDGQVGQSGG